MLVTFTTEAFADITMFGDVAVSLLKMMGYSGDVPGAIRANDIPEAIRNLKAALAEELTREQQVNNMQDEEDSEEPPVSISTRAQPLIDLLTAASRSGKHVMWK